MSAHLLSDIICQEFEKNPGRNQFSPMKQYPSDHQPKAMLISFNTQTNSDIEEGYRTLDILIYAPSNYVQVWSRQRWDVIKAEDLEEGEDGEVLIKEGKDYTKGESAWTIHSDHDSCWREDGVRDLIKNNLSEINTFHGRSWYEIITVPEEIKNLSHEERRLRRAT